jgi:hypothetical protein
MINAFARLLVNLTVLAALDVPSAWFPNDSEVGDTAACTRPVPVKETVCGLLLALSVMVRVPGLLPVAPGVNVTLMVQLAPAANDDPHVLVWA